MARESGTESRTEPRKGLGFFLQKCTIKCSHDQFQTIGPRFSSKQQSLGVRPVTPIKKRCNRCQKRKLLTAFCKHTAAPDGLSYYCRECQRAYQKRYYSLPENRARHRADVKRWLSVPQNRARWLAARNTPENRARGRAAKKRYLSIPENRARHRAACKRWLSIPENRARRIAYHQTPERKAAMRIYNQRPEVKTFYLIKRARRMADQLRARPAWADESVIKAIYAECAERRRAGEDVVCDHFWPLRPRDALSLPGLDVGFNLRIISAAENCAKSNRQPDEFYSRAEFKRITRELADRVPLLTPG